MKIILSRQQAESIGWANDCNRDTIRACFYLGYGSTFISEIVNNPMRGGEAFVIVKAAEELGMSENDIVLVL